MPTTMVFHLLTVVSFPGLDGPALASSPARPAVTSRTGPEPRELYRRVTRVRFCDGTGLVGGRLHQLLAEHAVLVQRGRLHDEYVAQGVLHDVAGDRSEALPLARAQPAVADYDEVRRVGADDVEQGLSRVAGDELLLDVSRSLLGETGERLFHGVA